MTPATFAHHRSIGLEMLGRYEENAYLMRMMKIVGHKDTRLFELDGYGHQNGGTCLPFVVERDKSH